MLIKFRRKERMQLLERKYIEYYKVTQKNNFAQKIEEDKIPDAEKVNIYQSKL